MNAVCWKNCEYTCLQRPPVGKHQLYEHDWLYIYLFIELSLFHIGTCSVHVFYILLYTSSYSRIILSMYYHSTKYKTALFSFPYNSLNDMYICYNYFEIHIINNIQHTGNTFPVILSKRHECLNLFLVIVLYITKISTYRR